MGLYKCFKCESYFSEEGTVIKTEIEDRPFCLKCLKGAYSILVGKKDKGIDEVELLSQIREYLNKKRRKIYA